MKQKGIWFLIPLAAVGCATDSVDRLADEATRAGMAAYRDPATRDSAFMAAAEKPIRVYYLARYQATPEQVREANRRAQQQVVRPRPETRRSTPETPAPRYQAVPVRNPSPRTDSEVSVMIYDTSTQRVVGQDLYELPSAPRVGQSIELDTLTMQYIGI